MSKLNYIGILILLLYNLISTFFFGPYILVNGSGEELIVCNILHMDTNDTANSSNTGDIAPQIVDLTGGSSNDVWIDLRLVRFDDNYYLVDKNTASGTNLINKLQSESGKENLNLSQVKYSSTRGVKLDIDVTTKLDGIKLQNATYKGLFLDLKFKDAVITSHTLPIQKNDSGQYFVV